MRTKNYDINLNNTLLLVIDIQDRLTPAIYEVDKMIAVSVKLIDAAKILNLPIINTLQYPRGLGENVPEIAEVLPQDAVRFEKTMFSAFDDISAELTKQGRRNILIVGAETHVCILQTVRDLIDAGYNPVVISDGCSSRTLENRLNGFEMMKDMGGVVMNYESVLFMMLQNAKHENFKQISNIVK